MSLSEFQRERIKLRANQKSQMGVAGLGVVGFGALSRLLGTASPTHRDIALIVALTAVAFIFALVMRQIAIWELRGLDDD